MKRILLAALFLIFVLQISVFAKPVYKRLTFAKGATQLIVKGRLNGYKDGLHYVLRLRQGQTLQISGDKSITLFVADKSGADVVDRAANCNGEANISPTAAAIIKLISSNVRKPMRGAEMLM